jgi:hypothetical protein
MRAVSDRPDDFRAVKPDVFELSIAQRVELSDGRPLKPPGPIDGPRVFQSNLQIGKSGSPN